MNHPPIWDDERLDLDWRERGNLVIGFIVALAFVLLMCFAGAADLPR